jgi:hypothetical protein
MKFEGIEIALVIFFKCLCGGESPEVCWLQCPTVHDNTRKHKFYSLMFIDSFIYQKKLVQTFSITIISLHFSLSANFLLMREIIKLKRVSVRNDAEACVIRLMRETWHLWWWAYTWAGVYSAALYSGGLVFKGLRYLVQIAQILSM